METFDITRLNNPNHVYRGNARLSRLVDKSGPWSYLETQGKPPVSSLQDSTNGQDPSRSGRDQQTSQRIMESHREASSQAVRIRIRKVLVNADTERKKIEFLANLGLQTKWVQEAPRRKSKRVKYSVCHYMAIYLSIIVLLLPVILAKPVDGPAMFDRDQQMDKLISKNQIGYHFKKVIRAVSQELFISRRLDVSVLFQGIQVLKHTGKDIGKYCANMRSSRTSVPELFKPMTSHFLQIGVPQFASYAEAKARCKARGMQLPEVYSTAQQIQLSAFLKQNDIRKCFAGLEPDIPDAIHRFASTGFPIWKAIQNFILLSNGKEQHLDVIMDDFNVKFMYEPDGELHMYSVNNIVKDYYHKMGSHT